MLRISLFLLAFLSWDSFAVGAKDLFKERRFECTVTSITATGDDIDKSFTWSSKDGDQGTHGGREFTFRRGKDEIVAVGNDKWMAVAWWRSGEKIGEAVNLITEQDADSRVLILLHPEDNDERVFMNCNKVGAQ